MIGLDFILSLYAFPRQGGGGDHVHMKNPSLFLEWRNALYFFVTSSCLRMAEGYTYRLHGECLARARSLWKQCLCTWVNVWFPFVLSSEVSMSCIPATKSKTVFSSLYWNYFAIFMHIYYFFRKYLKSVSDDSGDKPVTESSPSSR